MGLVSIIIKKLAHYSLSLNYFAYSLKYEFHYFLKILISYIIHLIIEFISLGRFPIFVFSFRP